MLSEGEEEMLSEKEIEDTMWHLETFDMLCSDWIPINRDSLEKDLRKDELRYRKRQFLEERAEQLTKKAVMRWTGLPPCCVKGLCKW